MESNKFDSYIELSPELLKKTIEVLLELLQTNNSEITLAIAQLIEPINLPDEARVRIIDAFIEIGKHGDKAKRDSVITIITNLGGEEALLKALVKEREEVGDKWTPLKGIAYKIGLEIPK